MSPHPLEPHSHKTCPAQQSPCVYSIHKHYWANSVELCCRRAIMKYYIMHIWLFDAFRSPKICISNFKAWGSWDLKTFWPENSRENCEELKFTVISSPLQPILAHFSSTSRERSLSKDSGIWLTDFVLSLSYFTECQMTTEAIQNSKNSGCFKMRFIVRRQLSLSSVTLLVLKPGRKE